MELPMNESNGVPELRVLRGGRALSSDQAVAAARDMSLPPLSPLLERGIKTLPFYFVEGKYTVVAITSSGFVGAMYHVANEAEYADAVTALEEFLRTCDPPAGITPIGLAR